MEHYDVAVVGAGPAGCAAALRTLQRQPDARVVMLDAAAFPRDKTCGDGIGPHVFDVFTALGVEGLDDGFPPTPALRVRSPHGQEAARPMARPARIIPRFVFDARLVEAAGRRGAELRRHRVRHVVSTDDGVVIDGQITADVLVAADGAHSAVRRELRLPTRGGTTALAIRGYATASSLPAEEMLIAVSGRDCPAYAWSFPLPDGRANVGFGLDVRRLTGGRDELLSRLTAIVPGQSLDPATVKAYHLPMSNGRVPLPDGRILLTGDAAALVNPITGEGIYYAARSGVLAADAAAAGRGAGARYRRLLGQALGRHHHHLDVLAACTRSPRFVDAAVASARARQGVFDDIIELGLAAGTATPALVGRVVPRYLAGLAGLPERRSHRPRQGSDSVSRSWP